MAAPRLLRPTDSGSSLLRRMLGSSSPETTRAFGSAARQFSSLTGDSRRESSLLSDERAKSPDRPHSSAPAIPQNARTLHALLFADAGHPVAQAAQAVLVLAWIGYSLWGAASDLGDGAGDVRVQVMCGLANAAECAINTAFGFSYCGNQHIGELMNHLQPLGVSAQESAASLRKYLWVSFAVSAAVMIGPIVFLRLTPQGRGYLDSAGMGTHIAFAVGNSFQFLQMMHLCACWLWTCTMYRRAALSISEKFMEQEAVASRQATKTVFALLAHMRATSQVWRLNHGARFFASIVLASSYWTFSYGAKYTGLKVWNGAIALSYFLSVWATAAYPGYVMSSCMGLFQRKLAEVASDDVSTAAADEDTPGGLMHRLTDATPYTGMHFAGAPMTVQKAATVGAVIWWFLSAEFSFFRDGG